VTLDQLGNIGEFVAAIATLVTLVYLAAQIRQNTRSVRATTFQESARSTFEIMDRVALDPELNRIYFAGTEDFDSLTQIDRRRFGTYMVSMIGRWENLEFQCQQGLIEREAFAFFYQNMRKTFSLPGTWQWWDKASDLFSPAVRQLVERECERPVAGSDRATSPGRER